MEQVHTRCKAMGLNVKSLLYFDQCQAKSPWNSSSEYSKVRPKLDDYIRYMSLYETMTKDINEGKFKFDKSKFDTSLSYHNMVLLALDLGDTLPHSECHLIEDILQYRDVINPHRDGFRGTPIPRFRQIKAPEVRQLYKKVTGKSTAGIAGWIYNQMMMHIYKESISAAVVNPKVS